MLPEASIAITKFVSVVFPVYTKVVPATENINNKIAKLLITNKIKFLESIFLPANLSIASKLENVKAFF